MEIKSFVFNPIQENTYVLWDETKECVIVDAGNCSAREDGALAEFIAENGLKPMMAINTHCHFDHIFGVEFLRDNYGVKFAASSADNELLRSAKEHCSMFGIEPYALPEAIDIDLASVEEVRFGNTVLRVIATPGHSKGCVSLLHEESKTLFTGDTLFRESIGRTDLPGGDYPTIMRSILGKILPLGDEVTIYPGHGDKSNIGHESLYNPFVVEALNGEVNFSN
ncbi:MAG: MBL fold metallo-hydrolase [Alistipes sp.]|nr:MBL fold metallo-hydrolase [Alistipes sp.]